MMLSRLRQFLRAFRQRGARRQPVRLDFTEIYRQRRFGGEESRSGQGSSLEQTRQIRRQLPVLLRRRGVRTLLDLPCGDFHWMQHVDLGGVGYIGGDVVEDAIASCNQHHADESHRFAVIDLLRDPLPECDLVFCRDCLVHLPYEDIFCAIANIKRSSANWLLTTTFTGRDANSELYGIWRPVNLQREPFNFPPPDELIVEGCPMIAGQDFSDKSLGLWDIRTLPDPPERKEQS
jgi:SAM-dependent methyltransferase